MLLCRELLCRCSCNIYACWPTNTAAVQTCLLVECYCKMDSCRTVATQSSCLLTFYHSILHVCWHCASLSAIHAGTISHVYWYGVSLSAMPTGVVLHYRACILVWYITISHTCLCESSLGHAFWCGASL